MNGLILFGVLITVILILFIGIFVGRKVEGDSQNFLVAGRMMPVYLVAPALMVAAVDSNATLGNVDLASQTGWWSGALLAIGLAIALLLSGIFIAKPMNEMGLFSLGDFFRLKYGKKFEKLASVIMVLSYTILLAGNLVAMGYLFNFFLGIPYIAGLFIAVGAVLLYTVFGGLYSDAYTATIQTVITLTASIIIGIFFVVNYGFGAPEGMGPFDWEQLYDPASGSAINWATIISLGIGDIVAIDFQQRIYSAKSPKVAQQACYVGAALTAIIGIIYASIATTAVSNIGMEYDGNPLLYEILTDYVPPAITVLVISGIVAASFSTASGAILGMSDMIVRNIGGMRRDSDTSHHDPQLRYVRLCMIPLGLFGVLIAARISQTGILLTLAFDLMLCCLIPALFGGLFWKRSSRKAVFASAIVGLVLRVTFFVLCPTVYGAENTLLYIPNDLLTADADGWVTFISFGASLGTFLLVAALCPRTADENADEKAETVALEAERTISSQALYERAVIAKREDDLDFYEHAKAAGFPVDAELAAARAEMKAPIPD
jgi:SSS family solute:Na+ symporter